MDARGRDCFGPLPTDLGLLIYYFEESSQRATISRGPTWVAAGRPRYETRASWAHFRRLFEDGAWTRRWSGACADVGRMPRDFERESPRSVRLHSRSTKPTKEPHDSIVPAFQWRRRRRSRGGEPTSAFGPAGNRYQAREIASAPCTADRGLAMTVVGGGFLSIVTSEGRAPLAMARGPMGWS